jgi:serine protease Do
VRQRVALLTLPWWPALARASTTLERSPALRLAVAPLVLKVEALGDGGKLGLGSGVVVAPGKVVTNAHVTRNATQLAVARGPVRLSVARQLCAIERDLCVLEVPELQTKPAALREDADELHLGQPLLAAGYTGGAGLQFSHGDVVALHRLEGARVIQSSNGFTSGASGGGLFDAQGNLVGVLTFRLRGDAQHSGHYYSAPLAWVRALLDAPSDRYEPVQPVPGVAYWEKPRQEQARFLQAGAAQAAQDWPALKTLCEPWTQDEPGNPQAWGLLGTACWRLGEHERSRQALERLEAIEGAQAWVQRLKREMGQA